MANYITPVSYITAASLNSRLSSAGVNLRFEDASGDVATVIADASIEADGYALLFYDSVLLNESNWFKLRVTDIAAMFACSRRANPVPQSVQFRYEKAIEELEKVRTGVLKIPDAPQRRSSAPQLSNQRVSLRPHPRVVVQPSRSTGTAEGYVQHVDPLDYDYNL